MAQFTIDALKAEKARREAEKNKSVILTDAEVAALKAEQEKRIREARGPSMEPQDTLMNQLDYGARGVPFIKEGVAAIKAPFSDKTYSELRGEEYALEEGYRSAFPGKATATTLGTQIPLFLATRGKTTQLNNAMRARAGLAPVGVNSASTAGIQGAVFGAGNAQGPYDSTLANRAQNTLMSGALASGITAGANKALPVLSDSAKVLLNQKIPLTVGQSFGRGMKAFEDKMASLPFFGAGVANARNRSVLGFNTAALNDALKSVNLQIPGNLKNNTQEAYIWATNKISGMYDKFYPKIKLTDQQPFRNNIKEVIELADDSAGKGASRIINSILKPYNKVKGKYPELSGEDIKKIKNAISKKIRNIKSNTDEGRAKKSTLAAMQAALFKEIPKQNPNMAFALRNIDTAYRKMVPIDYAMLAAKNKEGVFNPNQLINAMARNDRSVRKRALSTMQYDDFQPVVQAAGQRLPASIGDSGTAGRLLPSLGLLGGGYSLANDPAKTAMGLGGYLALASAARAGSTPLLQQALRTGLQAPGAVTRGMSPYLGGEYSDDMNTLLGPRR